MAILSGSGLAEAQAGFERAMDMVSRMEAKTAIGPTSGRAPMIMRTSLFQRSLTNVNSRAMSAHDPDAQD